MALIGLKQLDSILTGSLQISGSAGVTGSLSLIGTAGTPNAKILVGSSNNKLNIGDTIVVSDGNNRVGMGDTAPSAPDTELHIKSDNPVITLQRTANADRGAIEFQGQGGSVGAHIEYVSETNDLSFGTFDGSNVVERLRLVDGAGANIKVSGSTQITGSLYVSSSLTTSGNVSASKVYAADGFYHSDNNDTTYLKFPTGDKVQINAGDVNFIYAWQKDADVNKLIFNEDNTDTDIVFRSANGSNNKLLYLDASADKIGIKTGFPTEVLTVEGNISASGTLFVETHVTASGNISGSYIRGSRFELDGATHYIDQSLGSMFIVTTGDIAAQPGTGKALKITGGLSATSHITASGDVYVSGDVSGSATSTGSFGRVYVSGSNLSVAGGSLILGEDAYSLGANYVGLKTSFHTGSNDYMIISGKSDGSTYISAKDNSGVEIRGGGNRSNNSIIVPDDTYIKLGGSATTLLRPESDNTTDLGSATVRYKDIHLAGSVSGSATSTGSFGVIRVGGILYGPVDDHFDIKSDKDVKIYLDTDNDGTFHKLQVFNEDGDVKFAVAADGKAAIGEAVTSNSLDGLSVVGGISGSGNITGSDIYSSGNISGSATSTGSFGAISVGGGHFTSASLAAGGSGGSGGIFGDVGTSKTTTNNLQISGSLIVSGSTLTVRTGTDSGPPTASTAIYTNNITNGYPTSNRWQESLDGSYFNNFDHTTHVSEILRFMAGIISHSIDTSSPTANTKTFASVDTNNNNLGSTASQIAGRLPQNYTALSNATLNYLVLKGWTSVGAKIFDGISIYNNSSYYVDFDSNSGGSTSIQSSADSELFGLGGLTSGGATEFKVRVIATQSFSDTVGLTTPTAVTNSFTTQSFIDYTMTDFGTTSGVELAKIDSANPAVIPAAYQDGKFENIGGTALTGSLTRKYHASKTDFSSVSSSGYYNIHDLKIGIATGSGNFSFVNGTDRKYFYAKRGTINTAIGSNSLADVGTTTRYLTAVSRSLSGAPYVTGSTYEVTTKITGLFNPMYAATTTLTDMNGGSVGVGSVSITNDNISTNGGTIQTSNAIYDSTGASARSTSTVPYYNDIAKVSASLDWDAGNDDSIQQSSTLTDETFTVTVRARDRDSSYSTLDTQTIFYHSASMFGADHASGSMAVYGRAQGYDGGSLTGTTETFTGESYRIQLTDEVLGWSGSAFSTSFNISQVPGTRLIGEQDLQVKPGFLVDPGGDYGYWYPENYGSGSYKYYIRRFQTSGTKTSMTVNLNNNTLVNWKATTNNSVACGLLFKSSASGSGTNSKLSRARIYDPSETTSNLISSSVAHQNDFHLNPFNSAFDLYGNTGGSISSNTYTIPMRNSDGMYLDDNDNELYVIVRYSGDPTPLDDITLTFS
tara:strand:- start:827 stop:4960 length:4134 start_codon:yes stop_codon:yes gene_type:complete